MLLQLLQSLAFSTFISERGIPFRQCDIFDDLVAQEVFLNSSRDEQEMVDDLLQLAEALNKQEPVEIVNMPQSMDTIASAGVVALQELNGSKIEEILKKQQPHLPSCPGNSGVVLR
jgi:hypothetical protein